MSVESTTPVDSVLYSPYIVTHRLQIFVALSSDSCVAPSELVD